MQTAKNVKSNDLFLFLSFIQLHQYNLIDAFFPVIFTIKCSIYSTCTFICFLHCFCSWYEMYLFGWLGSEMHHICLSWLMQSWFYHLITGISHSNWYIAFGFFLIAVPNVSNQTWTNLFSLTHIVRRKKSFLPEQVLWQILSM